MTTTTHEPRLDLLHLIGGTYAAMARVEERIDLEPRLRHIVKLRASQMNGCAYCIDMHRLEALEDGDTDLRLAQLPAWRESPAFDARERAALALTESVTLISETHVPDDVWEEAARHFEAKELANLLAAIAAINFWTRLQATNRAIPASYAQEAAAA
jgi:AhpD family alkylhydroperoxidase